jgi:hypothetical protein
MNDEQNQLSKEDAAAAGDTNKAIAKKQRLV